MKKDYDWLERLAAIAVVLTGCVIGNYILSVIGFVYLLSKL